MTAQTKNALRVHVGLLIAEALCISAFIVELRRALSGNTLSWAYVFEWPILGVYGVFMWRRLLRDDAPSAALKAPDRAAEAALDQYNAYLEQVHRSSWDATPTSSPRQEPGAPT